MSDRTDGILMALIKGIPLALFFCLLLVLFLGSIINTSFYALIVFVAAYIIEVFMFIAYVLVNAYKKNNFLVKSALIFSLVACLESLFFLYLSIHMFEGLGLFIYLLIYVALNTLWLLGYFFFQKFARHKFPLPKIFFLSISAVFLLAGALLHPFFYLSLKSPILFSLVITKVIGMLALTLPAAIDFIKYNKSTEVIKNN